MQRLIASSCPKHQANGKNTNQTSNQVQCWTTSSKAHETVKLCTHKAGAVQAVQCKASLSLSQHEGVTEDFRFSYHRKIRRQRQTKELHSMHTHSHNNRHQSKKATSSQGLEPKSTSQHSRLIARKGKGNRTSTQILSCSH